MSKRLSRYLLSTLLALITMLTSPSAQIGIDTARGAQFMVDHLNGSGNVVGKKLELASTDDANDPQLAVQDAAQLIQRGRVVAIAGPTNSVGGIAIQSLQALCEEGPVV